MCTGFEHYYTSLNILSIIFPSVGSCKRWPLVSFSTSSIINAILAFLLQHERVFLIHGVSSRVSRGKDLNVDQRVFLLQCALMTSLHVVRHGSSSQARHLCSPLKLYVVKSSGRTWLRTSSHEIGVAVV